jgi:hypothetical protein
MVRRFLCLFLYFASMATGAGCFTAFPRLEPPVGDVLQLPPSVAVRIDDPKYLLQGAVCSSRSLEGAIEPGLEPRPAIPELSPLEMLLFLSAELDVTPNVT